MRGAGASLLTSTPPGPGEHSWSTARKRKEQPTKETADFRHGQGNGKRGSVVRPTCCRSESLLRTDDRQHRHNEQDKCDVAEPADKTTRFVVVYADVRPMLELLLNMPSGPNA